VHLESGLGKALSNGVIHIVFNIDGRRINKKLLVLR